MDVFDSKYFLYQNNQLYCEKIPVKEILEEVGTPAYIYSKKFFIDTYKEFDSSLINFSHKIFYAVKANFNLSVIKTFSDLGSGFDVNSEGELYRVMKLGIDSSKIIFSGVGKTANEIKIALENDLLLIKAESQEELITINNIAKSLNKKAKVAIRVNPDVDPKTHPYISTGLAENKFGIDMAEAKEIFLNSGIYKNIEFTGLDMHIGSQIITVDPFVSAVEKVSDLFQKLKLEGIHLKHLDLGGGIGVVYNHEKIFSADEYVGAISPYIRNLDCEIFIEPGRYFTANGGILAGKVLYSKKNHDKNFIIVDAAMNDLLRPSIYGSYHQILPVEMKLNREKILADIVGPVCESGDFLAKNRAIIKPEQGEYLAVMSSGSYGMTMASNYNARRRPPEILVDGDSFRIVRNRETFEHLLYDEIF